MKNQNQLCQIDKQDLNDRKSSVLTKFLAWFHSPIVHYVIVTTVCVIALQYDRNLTLFPTLIAIISLLLIAIHIVVSVTSLIIMVFKGRDKQILIKQLTQICCAVVIPILVVAIIIAIEITSGYVALRIMEPRLLQQIQQSPNQSFKYGRFDFRKFPISRWVIYDESDQVLLPANQRSKEWWNTTKEAQEAEVACFGEAQWIYSHFFIRTDSCSIDRFL